MNKANGFITLHRKILDWEWYKNTNTKVLFLHLLLNANFQEGSFEGHKILRGQLVTSLPSLSAELGLTIKQIRGSLDHLISTGEVTSTAFPRYRIITVVRYNDYQDDGSLIDSQKAGERAAKGQPKGSQRAGSGQAEGSQRAAIEQYNNDNNVNKETMEQESMGKTAKRFTPPTLEEVSAYCQERGKGVDPDRWYNYYSSNGWKVGKNPMKDWKAAVRTWESNGKSSSQPARPAKQIPAQQYEQRDYSDQEESMEQVLRRLRQEGYC